MFRALADPSRRLLLDRLNDHDGQTLGELCTHLPQMTRFGVMNHLRVLEEAGLVRVVRTAKVRALTEKYYGRTARTFLIKGPPDEKDPFFMLNEAMRHCRLPSRA